MTFEEAQQLVALGESETQEFKQTTGQRTESAHTLVGMLHRHGGRVWFGVTPRAEPVGQDVSDKTLEDLAAVYRDIEPTVYPSIERIPTPTGRELISVRVERGPMPPYSFRGKSWTRSGTMNQELEVEERNRMLVERLHGSRRWENEVAEGWTVDDLDDDEIARTVTIAAERGRLGEIGSRDPRVLLERLRLVAHDGAVLRAAVVLFGDRHKIEATYPQCQLRVGKLRETISGGFGDLRHLYGSAFRLLEIAEEFIRENTPKPGRLIPGVFERADDPFYPPLALREALANALCHRDYSIGGGAVTIRLHADNRLEIISSGGLHFGLTRDALFRPHDSKPWNPLIADVFYRRGLIDSFGTGIERMTEQMRQAGLPTPDIDDVGGSVIVALSPPEKSREERIIDVVRRQGAITTSEAMAVIGASRATAKRLLTNLADEGQLELRGKGRKSHYVLP